MTALLSEISIFYVRTVCETYLAQESYGSKHASQPLRDKIFVYAYTHNSKTTGRIRKLYKLNDYSTIEDIYFLYQSWMGGTNDELWLQTLITVLSDKPFVHAYTHKLKTTGYIWTFSILNNCSTIRHIPCVLVQSCKRDPTGELRLQTCIDCSLTQSCVRILQVCIYIAIWYATTHDN